MTGPAPGALPGQIADATRRMTEWLCALPEWPTHPVNASRSVSAHYGPTILSEHDCVMHYARFLSQAGVAWEDMHLELSPGQWMYETTGASPSASTSPSWHPGGWPAPGCPCPPERCRSTPSSSSPWPATTGSSAAAPLAPCEPRSTRTWTRSGQAGAQVLGARGYVVVVEECDHSFPAAYAADAGVAGVDVLLLQQWRRP